METIKVNMNPNPLDVQTIHASQNDGEARQWEFELHNNGELIDTSEITEQLFFKAYKGGTEQLLPENTSVPTTTPILADIQYPDGLRTGQYFTYRETPTTVSNKARIKTIKGNTVVWNQLIRNGNFTDSSYWTTDTNYGSIAVANNVLTYTAVQIYNGNWYNRVYCSLAETIEANHKLLIKMRVDATKDFPLTVLISSPSGQSVNRVVDITSSQKEYSVIVNTTLAGANTFATIFNLSSGYSVGDTLKLGDIQVFDLTKIGLDISNPSEFTSLFGLPYYAYNQGSLLSFNGNGIKTVGKNLFNKENVTTGGFLSQDGSINSNPSYSYSDYIPILPNERIVISGVTAGGAYTCFYDGNKNLISSSQNQHAYPYTYNANASYVRVSVRLTELNSCQIELGSTATSYEPYTESILSLPISTYFPTGMKSAYNSSSLTDIVRDELSQTKATKKVKQITYDGSSDESWSSEPITSGSASGQHNFYINVAPAKKLSLAMNNMAVPYALYTTNYIDGNINAWVSSWPNLNFYPGTDITSVADFRTWLSNHPLTVNIALPTDGYEETPITTASLVTENGEIPLSNEDGVLLCKCTEQLSENPGFIDAKIKLSDADGECYSNKLQLHVERSPQ